MFVGRQKELEALQALIQRPCANLVVIKGRRRIGKSRLITEFGKAMKMITLTGLPPTQGSTQQDERRSFAEQLSLQFQIPVPRSESWEELFWHLADRTKRGRVLILLDEISWWAHDAPLFLSQLKNTWDVYFTKNKHLILVLCGSISSFIDKNILNNTGFVGRIALKLHLKELPLHECNAFWGTQTKIAAYEKFKLLSITGGIPSYLEKINPHLSAEENIRRLCFVQDGVLVSEFDQIFTDVFGKRSAIYKQILMALLETPRAQLEEIYTHLGIEKQGVISEYLHDLEQAGFIRRDYAFNLKTKTLSKYSLFRISDNFVRFYLKYIAPNMPLIIDGRFEHASLSTLKNWETIAGLQFENLVLNNKNRILTVLHVHPSDVLFDNAYMQLERRGKPGVQIDYLIVDKFNTLWLCEVKFSRNPISKKIIPHIEKKIEALACQRRYSIRPVLIHVNGVTDDLIGEGFFSSILDFGTLLTSA